MEWTHRFFLLSSRIRGRGGGSSLIQFDPVWSRLIQFDSVWSSLVQFDPVWSSLVDPLSLASDNGGGPRPMTLVEAEGQRTSHHVKAMRQTVICEYGLYK